MTQLIIYYIKSEILGVSITKDLSELLTHDEPLINNNGLKPVKLTLNQELKLLRVIFQSFGIISYNTIIDKRYFINFQKMILNEKQTEHIIHALGIKIDD